MLKINDQKKGIISLVVLSFVFASMGLFSRYLATGFGLFQQVYLRVFSAFVLGFLFFNKSLNFSKLKKLSLKEWLIIAVRAASFYLFGVILFSQALLLTKYSNVSFIGALPLTALFSVIFFREKITWRKVLFTLTAFIGIIIISVKDYAHIFQWGRGEILTLISAAFFSFSYITRKWQSKLLTNKELTQITLLLGFILVFLTSLVKGDPLPMGNWNWILVLVVIGAGLFNVINLFLTNYGFEKVESILAGNILTLESVFAVILGFVFYKEVPLLKEILGGMIIIGSVIAMNYLEEKETKN